jgi:hypothetical protein
MVNIVNISWLHLVILILAAFRLTRLIVNDEITAAIRRPFILAYQEKEGSGDENGGRFAQVRSWIGALLSCHWCFGIWSATILVALYAYVPAVFPVFVILAVAGAAAFLESRVF